MHFRQSEEVMAGNIALLVGSLRKESFSRKIGTAIAELAPDSLHFEPIEIGNLPLYNQDLDPDRPPRPWIDFRDRIRRLDAALFVTPEYNRSIPGVLKNAIDVGSRPYGHSVWAGKAAGVVSVTPGPLGAFGANHHLRQCCVVLDMPVLQQPEMYITHVGKAFDGETLIDGSLQALLKKFGVAFDKWVARFTHEHAAQGAA
jgi:chromate reductase